MTDTLSQIKGLMCESWEGFKNGKCIACNHDHKQAEEIIKQRQRDYLGD